MIQERQETTNTRVKIVHASDNYYFLNMHALHNAAKIRKVLPRHLTAPSYIFPNRQQHHVAIAQNLQITGPKKRAEARAKAKETREKNKRGKSHKGKEVMSNLNSTEIQSEESDVNSQYTDLAET
jgi:hypothetical protein